MTFVTHLIAFSAGTIFGIVMMCLTVTAKQADRYLEE